MEHLQQQIKDNQNFSGGGLAVNVTGRFESNRKALADLDGSKRTAGETAKWLKKHLGIKKLYAKEVVKGYKLLKGFEPEWHHAGFYRGGNGRKTMGRTFYFNDDDLAFLLENWEQIEVKNKEKEEKEKAEAERRSKKRKYAERWGTRFVRVSKNNIPKHADTESEEMDGKYGWFEAQYHYNLPVYYSGVAFKSKRILEKYLSI